MTGRRAFTLVELVMGIAVFAVGIVGVLAMFGQLGTQQAFAEFGSRAAPLAHGLLEEITSKRFDELIEPDGGGNWSVIGPDGEAGRAQYDDVDDFNGFSENMAGGLAGFSRSAAVTYATTTSGVIVSAAAQNNPYKRITVTVTGPGGKSFQVTGLATTLNSQGVSNN